MQCYIPVGVLQGTNNIQTFTVTLYRIKTKLKVNLVPQGSDFYQFMKWKL